MADKATKALLAAIALGLWLNLLMPVAHADAAADLASIAHDLHGLYTGNCQNLALCR